MWQNSYRGAQETGKTAKKPIAIYVAAESADLVELSTKLAKDLGDRKEAFLWVLEVGHAVDLKARELESAPAVVVLDPNASEPLAKVALGVKDGPEVLNKALDEAAKKVKK